MSAAPLAGQVAIVTGVSRGIGRAIAGHLARRGATVAGIARPSAALTELRHEAEHEGLGLVTFLADVTVPTDIELAFATVTAQLRSPDLVVACAGTAEVLGPLWLADPDLWWQAVAVDLRGTMLTARAAVSRMLPRRTGRLVTVYGNLGDRQMGNVSALAVAKAGIARLTEHWGASWMARDTGVLRAPWLRAHADDRAPRVER